MKLYFRSAIILIFALFITACIHRSVIVNKPKPLVEIEKPKVELKELWSRDIGKYIKNGLGKLKPAVFGDTVFVSSFDGNILALELKTGRVIWQKKLNKSISSGIVVNAEAVYVSTIDGILLAFSVMDGHQLWRVDIGSELISLPGLSSGLVAVLSMDDTLTLIDAKTGSIKWRQPNNQPALTLRGGSSPVIRFGVVFVGLHSGLLRAYQVLDGALLWSEKISAPRGKSELKQMLDVSVTPIISDNNIYVVNYHGKLVSFDFRGNIVWSTDLSSVYSMAQGFGTIYLTAKKDYLTAVDQSQGKVLWQQKSLEYRKLNAPQVYKNYVFAGDGFGYLHFFDQINGQLVGRYKFRSSTIKKRLVESQPIVDNNLIILLDSSSVLHVLTAKNLISD